MRVQRTSQRRASSSEALFRLIQFTAAKKQTATDLSFCSVTRNESRLSVLSPRAKATLLISNPFPTSVLNDCCSLRAAIGRLQQADQPEGERE